MDNDSPGNDVIEVTWRATMRDENCAGRRAVEMKVREGREEGLREDGWTA